jgi:hypothetical protein
VLKEMPLSAGAAGVPSRSQVRLVEKSVEIPSKVGEVYLLDGQLKRK